MFEPEQQNISPMYDPKFEHDACGIGAVISIQGVKTYDTVDRALKIVEKLEHRAGKDASGEVGDGVGLMIQVPHRLMLMCLREKIFDFLTRFYKPILCIAIVQHFIMLIGVSTTEYFSLADMYRSLSRCSMRRK